MELSVTRITVADDFIFVVASPGFCMAFRENKNGSFAPHRERDGQIWYFDNIDERIMLVFYNKLNDSIIIVSCTRHGNGFETRALPLENIRRHNHWDNGVRIFGDGSECIPSFYDNNNIAVVPRSTSADSVYEMNNYNIVHSFGSKKILFVRSRPGLLIVAYTLTETYLQIEVLSTENWVVLKRINYGVPPRGFDVVWLCEDNILLKEVGRPICMINIWNNNSVNLIKQENNHHKLLAIYDLTGKRLLLRYKKNIVIASGNSHDEQVAILEDNEVRGNNVDSDTYVTRDKNYAMVYSRKHIQKPRQQGINITQDFACIGSINICNTFNGESVWKINPFADVDLAIGTREEGGNNMTNIHSIPLEALQDVTALFYDEERHRIYTGNKRGFFSCVVELKFVDSYVVHARS